MSSLSASGPPPSSPWQQWLLASPWRSGLLLWGLYLSINGSVNALSVVEDYERRGLALAAWEPFCWEFSSALLIGLLIPAVGWALNRFPLDFRRGRRRLAQSVMTHVLAGTAFSLIHVVGMVGLRKLTYLLADGTYEFGHWPTELVYEYRKDAVTYALIVAVLLLYRYFRRQHLEAAGHATITADDSDSNIQRLLIKKRGREYLLKVQDIDWAQAAGNYVTLHKGSELHPLRTTMAALERSLPDNFCRVHRSAIVNLDQVAEITPQGTGDHLITLTNGAEVSFSRRYRDQVMSRIRQVAP